MQKSHLLNIFFMILVLMKGNEAASRGVICALTDSNGPKSSEEQLRESMDCAVSCLNNNVTNCAAKGFVMLWDNSVHCFTDGTTATGTYADYSCKAASA